MKALKIFGTLAAAAFLTTSAMADNDIDLYGQISAVDDANKTITITGQSGAITIKVLPHTEIKGDDCGAFGQDVYGNFKDLNVGKFVKVEALPYGGSYNTNTQTAGIPKDMQLTAKEIEWKCTPKAY